MLCVHSLRNRLNRKIKKREHIGIRNTKLDYERAGGRLHDRNKQSYTLIDVSVDTNVFQVSSTLRTKLQRTSNGVQPKGGTTNLDPKTLLSIFVWSQACRFHD